MQAKWCPPRLLISVVVVWTVVTALLYLLRPMTRDLPLWATTMIVVPVAVVVIQLWVMPFALRLRAGCEESPGAR